LQLLVRFVARQHGYRMAAAAYQRGNIREAAAEIFGGIVAARRYYQIRLRVVVVAAQRDVATNVAERIDYVFDCRAVLSRRLYPHIVTA